MWRKGLLSWGDCGKDIQALVNEDQWFLASMKADGWGLLWLDGEVTCSLEWAGSADCSIGGWAAFVLLGWDFLLLWIGGGSEEGTWMCQWGRRRWGVVGSLPGSQGCGAVRSDETGSLPGSQTSGVGVGKRNLRFTGTWLILEGWEHFLWLSLVFDLLWTFVLCGGIEMTVGEENERGVSAAAITYILYCNI